MKMSTSAAALGYAAPARAKVAADAAGDAASREALARLDEAVRELRTMAVEPLLQNAIAALQADDATGGAEWAIKALEKDERSGFGWYLLAISREKAGDFASALKAYESALSLMPDHGAIANDLGRLACRLGMRETAEKLFRHFLAAHPGHHEGVNNLACALRDQGRYDEAIELLKPILMAQPHLTMLWNTLGSVVAEQGDLAGAVTFFTEAMRLDPDFAKARYNRGNVLAPLGELDAAYEDVTEALKGRMNIDEWVMMDLARSTIELARGNLAEGWDAYETRLHPHFSDLTNFIAEGPRWEPGADLSGKTLLVIGEQGLGDEVLFANLLPDVIQALGPGGRLKIAVEPRLVPLFQRSFPMAEVGAHGTYMVDGHCARVTPFEDGYDLWTPLASLLRRFRRSVEAFPDRVGYMRADPERVAWWKGRLPPGRTVGVLWKSLKLDGARSRFFTPFQQWAPVLKTPGITFVNLQYGDCAEELAQLRAEGVDMWQPPGIDLKQDLDEVAALCCALDLVLGPPNATTNIAAACGATTWLVSNQGAWPRLGTGRYPWYPQARIFLPATYGEWSDAMEAVAAALAEG